MADKFINVTDPDSGQVGSVPAEQLQEALSQGFKQATPDEIHGAKIQEQYGSDTQAAITGLEGAASAATFGASTALERGLGVSGEAIQGRREANPIAHGAGQVAGLVGSSLLLPGGGAAGLLGDAGEVAAGAIGSRIGSAAVKSAVENAMFQGGDEVSKMISGDPHQSAQTAMLNTGLSGVMGGAVGAGMEAVSPLWKAAFGPQMTRVLSTMQDKVGGTDVVGDDMGKALTKLGIDVPPEVRANLSDVPELQNIAKTLEQRDTTAGGIEFQKSLKDFKQRMGTSVVEGLGRTASDVEGLSDLSKYEAGKAIGHTLADEFDEKLGPVAKEFEELKAKYANTPLDADAPVSVSNPVAMQGTTSKLAEDIAKLAQEQGWMSSPSSDIMREVNRVLHELPKQETLSDLTKYATEIGNNMQANPLNRPLIRAGALIKNLLRDAESEVAMKRLGSEAPELVERYSAARDGYKELSQMKEALDERLHTRASTSGFGKALGEMGSTDGESVLRRLSGTNDADLLGLLQDHFPKTAEALKNYHVDSVLKHAYDKAKDGDFISTSSLLKAVAKMSPEMRSFAISPEALSRLDAADQVLTQFNKVPHNFSNTARTLDKLTSDQSASAMSMVSGLLGHGFGTGFVVGKIGKLLGRDIPDATRLALLKFMGSSEPVSGGAFASMVNYIAHTMDGETLLTKGVQNLFKAGTKVLPESKMPSEKKRSKLDKFIEHADAHQENMLKVGEHASHYLPDHASAMAEMAGTALQQLQAMRPKPIQPMPFDKPIEPGAHEMAQWHRTLDVAEQPLSVLQHIQDGTVAPRDIELVKSLYPALYQRMNMKIMNEVAEIHANDESIPYHTRIGLALFMGQPLDSSMTPQAIQANQAVLAQGRLAQPQQQPQPGGKPSKAGMMKMKMAQMTALPSSAAAQRKQTA